MSQTGSQCPSYYMQGKLGSTCVHAFLIHIFLGSVVTAGASKYASDSFPNSDDPKAILGKSQGLQKPKSFVQ